MVDSNMSKTLAPVTIEEFERRLQALDQRLQREGLSAQLEADFAILSRNAGLQIVLGPTHAFIDKEAPDRPWPTEFDFRAYNAMFDGVNDFASFFTHERWGEPKLSLSKSMIEGNLCPAIRVQWSKPLELLSNYKRNEQEVSRMIDGMIAPICFLFAVSWRRWRLEVLEDIGNSPLGAWNA